MTTKTRKKSSKKATRKPRASTKKAASKPAKKESKPRYQRELAVDFGGVSIGDETASVGILFERNGHSIDDVEAMLCGKRLDVLAVVGTAADQAQQQFPGMEGEGRPHVAGSCDSARISINPKEFSARLKFSLGEIDVGVMAGIAKRKGTLRLNVLGDIEPTTGGDSDDDEDLDDRQGRLIATTGVVRKALGGVDDGAAMPIRVLAECGLTAKECEKLAASPLEITTVGRLEEVMRDDPWWHRKVPGVGKSKIDKVTDALLKFRQAHPVPSGDEAVAESQTSEPVTYPDRNGDAEDGDFDGVNRRVFQGDDCEVTIATGVRNQVWRSSAAWQFGEEPLQGRTTPRGDSEPHKTDADAFRAAVGELATAWSKAGGKRRKAATALAQWGLDQFPEPAGDSVPADVPY